MLGAYFQDPIVSFDVTDGETLGNREDNRYTLVDQITGVIYVQNVTVKGDITLRDADSLRAEFTVGVELITNGGAILQDNVIASGEISNTETFSLNKTLNIDNYLQDGIKFNLYLENSDSDSRDPTIEYTKTETVTIETEIIGRRAV